MLDIVEGELAAAQDAGVTRSAIGDTALQEAAAAPEFEAAFRAWARTALEWNDARTEPLLDRVATSLDDNDFLAFTSAAVEAFALCEPQPGPSITQATPLPTPPSFESLPESRSELAVMIRDRFEQLVMERDLPYRLTQAEFQDVGPEAGEINLPEGVWWIIQIEDPLESASDLPLRQLIFDKLLELFRDSIAPTFGDMDFVVGYIISFRDPQQTVYQIDAFDLRLYIRGEITTRQMTQKMSITGL